ncbi:MAG: (2Fe-2S)-binding protein [Pseudonocardiaceae bacterium]
MPHTPAPVHMQVHMPLQVDLHVPTGASAPTSGPYPRHPLAASVAAADRAVDWMSFRLLDVLDAEWNPCEQALSDPGFFTRWRASVAGWLGAQHADVPERTTAGYVLQWYLSIPAYLGAMLFHSARRVPLLQPRQLAFRCDPGWVQEVALRPGRFWCLPGDPDAGHPDAAPVSDEVALGEVLRREVVSHAYRFLRVYGPLVRFGRRTLWAAVTDSLDTGLLLAGRSFGSASAGAADAQLVLAERVEPLTSMSTTCAVIDDRERTHWTRRRGSCCFYYALSGVAEPCATCPRIDDAGRARILGALDHP